MLKFPLLSFTVLVALLGTPAHVALLLWARRTWPVRFASRWWFVACFAAAFLTPLTRKLTLHTRSPFADALNALWMLELTFVMIAALPLIVVTLLAPRRAARAAAPSDDANRESPPRREALHTIGGAAVLGTTGLVLGWGATRGRHDYEVREIEVRIPGLPRALDGYAIAQVSDIHAGLFVGAAELGAGLSRVRAMKPDLVVVTGDLVDFDVGDAAPLARALADLAPRDGVFGIVGNHDYYAGVGAVLGAMRSAGITMLVNDARIIRPGDGGGFALLGIDDEWARRYGGQGPDLARAMASVPRDAPRILLAHQPLAFVKRAAGHVALQLSGHTHGGQIRPFDLVLDWAEHLVAGRYESKGSTLYVNRGFGVAGPPARLGVPPEITKVVLVAA